MNCIKGPFTSSPFHVEVEDLLSASYIYHIAPKIWYIVTPSQCKKFEAFIASNLLDSDYANEYDVLAPRVLGVRTILFNPTVLLARAQKLKFPEFSIAELSQQIEA